MTRLWPDGLQVTIKLDEEGNPGQFVWLGRSHKVNEITRRWRVKSDWWRGLLWRDYFKVTTDTGLLLIIFNDLVEEEWYIQRLYD